MCVLRAACAALFAVCFLVLGAESKRAELSVFERFGLDPAPEIVTARDFSGNLSPMEWARSILYDSGREVIVLSPGAMTHENLEHMLEHEAAHLRAWRDYGPHIETHGREWRRTCRKYARLKTKSCAASH